MDSLTRLGPFLLTLPPLAFHLPTQRSGVYPSPNSNTHRSATQALSQEMVDFRYRLGSLRTLLHSSQKVSLCSLPLSPLY